MSADPQFITRPAHDIHIGDVLDLEHDDVARPDKSIPSVWEFEYGRVIAFTHEGADVYLQFDNGYTEGFDPNHEVRAMTNATEAGYGDG